MTTPKVAVAAAPVPPAERKLIGVPELLTGRKAIVPFTIGMPASRVLVAEMLHPADRHRLRKSGVKKAYCGAGREKQPEKSLHWNPLLSPEQGDVVEYFDPVEARVERKIVALIGRGVSAIRRALQISHSRL